MNKQKRFVSVDILRGLAASWVVFHHLWNRYYPGETSQFKCGICLDQSVEYYFCYLIGGCGYFGVTLFFVLSGFCISLPFIINKNDMSLSTANVKQYYFKRFKRIYPAYFASMIFAVILQAIPGIAASVYRGYHIDILDKINIDSIAIGSFFLYPFFHDSLEFNPVYWTLTYEVQFYILFPLLILLMSRVNILFLLVILLAIESYVLHIGKESSLLFINRYFEWYLGVFAANYYVSSTENPSSAKLFAFFMAFFVLSLYSLESSSMYFLRDIYLATSFSFLLLWCVFLEANQSIKNVLHSRLAKIIAFIGLFSYSLYLINIPVIDFVWISAKTAEKYNIIAENDIFLIGLISLPAAYLGAYVFYLCFEKPLLAKTE